MGIPTTADALLREAHEQGYRFPVGFDGFTARIGWETPAGSGEGTALVRPGIEAPVETSEIDEWADRQLRSLVGHRRPGRTRTATAQREAGDRRRHPLGSRMELDDESTPPTSSTTA